MSVPSCCYYCAYDMEPQPTEELDDSCDEIANNFTSSWTVPHPTQCPLFKIDLKLYFYWEKTYDEQGAPRRAPRRAPRHQWRW